VSAFASRVLDVEEVGDLPEEAGDSPVVH